MSAWASANNYVPPYDAPNEIEWTATHPRIPDWLIARMDRDWERARPAREAWAALHTVRVDRAPLPRPLAVA